MGEGGKQQMKALRKRACALTLGTVVVVVVGMAAAGLQARSATGGKFTLPFGAQWGIVSLEPGDYTFSVDHLTSNGAIALYRGTQAVGMFHPQLLDNYRGKEKTAAALLLIRHDGKVTVRALQLPQVGTFYFAVPKGLTTLVAQQPQLIETVSVQVGGQ